MADSDAAAAPEAAASATTNKGPDAVTASNDRIKDTELDEPQDAVKMKNMSLSDRPDDERDGNNASSTAAADEGLDKASGNSPASPAEGQSSSSAAAKATTSTTTPADGTDPLSADRDGDNDPTPKDPAEQGRRSSSGAADVPATETADATATTTTTTTQHDDNMSIQPAGESSAAGAAAGSESGPVCNVTLLVANGNRHLFKLDAKYLAKRNVEVPEATEDGQPDPFSISVYKLKQLILREWRDEWEDKPRDPSSIRLIHFGKLLEDKDSLKTYRLTGGAANIIHMTIKPAEMMEEDEAAKGATAGGSRSSQRRSGGCCVIL